MAVTLPSQHFLASCAYCKKSGNEVTDHGMTEFLLTAIFLWWPRLVGLDMFRVATPGLRRDPRHLLPLRGLHAGEWRSRHLA